MDSGTVRVGNFSRAREERLANYLRDQAGATNEWRDLAMFSSHCNTDGQLPCPGKERGGWGRLL